MAEDNSLEEGLSAVLQWLLSTKRVGDQTDGQLVGLNKSDLFYI